MSQLFCQTRQYAARGSYKPGARNLIRQLFCERFPAFESLYEERYSASCGKYRLPVIQRAAEAFRLCGDWREGIARVHCADCGYDLFVPFSCKSFFLCPPCGQKRTLLLGEYLSKDLLLTLPHRQFVWTIPRCLRMFLKHDRSLHAQLSRLVFTLLSDYYSEAAGRQISTGMVSSLQTFGEYAGWNPHWHTIVLEGGLMTVIAVIRDPESIRRIIDCMGKQGRGPPAFKPNSRN